jgi:hypothetical protein
VADDGRREPTPEEREAEWENRRPGVNTWARFRRGDPPAKNAKRKKSYKTRLRELWVAESDYIIPMFAELRARGLAGDTQAIIAWLQWIVGKPRTQIKVQLDAGRWPGSQLPTSPADVREAAVRALGEDVIDIAANAAEEGLDDEEHARLVAVARATAPTRAEDADPLAGKSDDEVLAEARRLLQAPGAEQREFVEGTECGGSAPAGREGTAVDCERVGGAQEGDP